MTSDHSKSQLVSALTQLTAEDKIKWYLKTKNSLSIDLGNTGYESDFFYETSLSGKKFILFYNSPKNIFSIGISISRINSINQHLLIVFNNNNEELNIQGTVLESLYSTVQKKIGNQETIISEIIEAANKMLKS